MVQKYKTLLKAAIPSDVVRSWYLQPDSKLVSHTDLAWLIFSNHHLFLKDKIEYLEMLKAECKDIFDEEPLYKYIEDRIVEMLKDYNEFVKPVTGYLYISRNFLYVSSTLENLLKVMLDDYGEPFDGEGQILVQKLQIDGDEISSAFISPTKDIYATSCRRDKKFDSNTPDFVKKFRKEGFSTLINYFKPGDYVFNIFDFRKGTIKEVKSSFFVTVQVDDSDELETWQITDLEYYLPHYDNGSDI